MKKSKLTNIQANGNWKDFYKFDVEFEDGTIGTIFKKSSEHRLEIGKEYNYSKNEKGSIKIIPEGGVYTTNYTNNDERQKYIIRQSMLKAAVDFHSNSSCTTAQVIGTAEEFEEWVLNKKKPVEVPF
tara:strand:+ start:1344 stop:1724 length:381 start_codon:yes stop_codon:yes gene_type:complete